MTTNDKTEEDGSKMTTNDKTEEDGSKMTTTEFPSKAESFAAAPKKGSDDKNSSAADLEIENGKTGKEEEETISDKNEKKSNSVEETILNVNFLLISQQRRIASASFTFLKYKYTNKALLIILTTSFDQPKNVHHCEFF